MVQARVPIIRWEGRQAHIKRGQSSAIFELHALLAFGIVVRIIALERYTYRTTSCRDDHLTNTIYSKIPKSL